MKSKKYLINKLLLKIKLFNNISVVKY